MTKNEIEQKLHDYGFKGKYWLKLDLAPDISIFCTLRDQDAIAIFDICLKGTPQKPFWEPDYEEITDANLDSLFKALDNAKELTQLLTVSGFSFNWLDCNQYEQSYYQDYLENSPSIVAKLRDDTLTYIFESNFRFNHTYLSALYDPSSHNGKTSDDISKIKNNSYNVGNQNLKVCDVESLRKILYN